MNISEAMLLLTIPSVVSFLVIVTQTLEECMILYKKATARIQQQANSCIDALTYLTIC